MFRERFRAKLRLLSQRFHWSTEEQDEVIRLCNWYLEATSHTTKSTFDPNPQHPHPNQTVAVQEGEEEIEETQFPQFQMLKIMELLGEGGMGKVYRAKDEALGRDVALKILRPELAQRANQVDRFIEEAQVTARLQHPGVVPIHAIGTLPDGRVGFLMQRIQGKTLMEVIKAIHLASIGQWRPEPQGWSFRRLMDAFLRICETMSYAHSQGVIHLDLKSANVMVGSFGEVFVLDWGLNRVLDVEGNMDITISSFQTHIGKVAGTPQYMAPEQARGEMNRIGPASDVYALGGMLFEILTGKPPIQETSTLGALQAACRGEVGPLQAPGPIPEELEKIMRHAMAPEIVKRYRHAGEMAAEVGAWLQGTRQQEQALELVDQADRLSPLIEICRQKAQVHRVLARQKMEGIKGWEPIGRKKLAWAEEDEADRIEREATLKALERAQCLHAALNLVPTLPEAHDRLADIYKDQLLAAEAAGDVKTILQAEVLLKAHDRGRYTSLLKGLGRLTLHTNPSGASVKIFHYKEQDRRLVPVLEREEGPTPISIELPQGSYIALIQFPGRQDVRYPFLIERGGHWDGIPPQASQPLPVYLPPKGVLGVDDIYVPASYFIAGGDPQALDSLPSRRYWVDGFVIRRFPVTCEEYLAFLNQLIQEGREEEALRWAPRSGNQAGGDALIWERDPSGNFRLCPDPEGRPCTPEMAVNRISWKSAAAFTAWMAQKEGRPWRLLHELEREKAGKGVDGRIFPWGRHFDASWVFTSQSHSGKPQTLPVTHFPEDESPYGVRWLAGGSSDFCINAYDREGPQSLHLQVQMEETDLPRAVRGGSWLSAPISVRLASRLATQPDNRFGSVGLRLAFSIASYPVVELST